MMPVSGGGRPVLVAIVVAEDKRQVVVVGL